jgi:hypothetical protein
MTPFNDLFQLYAEPLTADAAYAADPSGDAFRAWHKAKFEEWCEFVNLRRTPTEQDVADFYRWLFERTDRMAA